MNIKSVLQEQFKDLISEETLTAVEEAFVEAVDSKAKEKIVLEVKNVTKKIDADHSKKLQALVEKIDTDHTAKVKKLVEAIDMDHSVKLDKVVQAIDKKHVGMLEQIIEKYETAMATEAKEFQSKLVREVSNYIDLYLEKLVPKNQISEAVNNIRAQKMLTQVRQIVGITEEFVDGEIKEALKDGKGTIDSLRKELDGLIKENADLSAKANKAEAKLLLAEKTESMSEHKKEFVTRFLKNKAPEYIVENFEYVVDMFDREQEDEESKAKDEVKKNLTEAVKIDRPVIVEEKQHFSNEIAEDGSTTDTVRGYLNEMERTGARKYSR